MSLLLLFFNLSIEKKTRLFRLADGKRSILAMALVYKLVSRIMSIDIDKPVCTIQTWAHLKQYKTSRLLKFKSDLKKT